MWLISDEKHFLLYYVKKIIIYFYCCTTFFNEGITFETIYYCSIWTLFKNLKIPILLSLLKLIINNGLSYFVFITYNKLLNLIFGNFDK